MRIALLVAAFVVAVSATQAAPVTGAARDAFAGGWRAGACGVGAEPNAASFTLEFAMTGGLLTVDTGDERSGQHPIEAVDVAGEAFSFKSGSDVWRFKRAKDGGLTVLAAPSLYSELKTRTFHRCQPPADRSAIHLNAKQTAAISASMPNGPYLIDLRARKGCQAIEYQYLTFDLVGPTGFELHRWNSSAVGEKLANGGKLNFAIDEISNFRIEQADAIPGGYRFKITELIPPNGSRGDTTTITVNIKGKTAAIPEWKRTYALCSEPIP